MIKKSIVYIFFCLLYILITECQDCRVPGSECDDSKQCCGGCCMKGICKISYALCILHEDPCLEHDCPPGEECYLYTPIGCTGCETQTDCRPTIY